MQVILKEHVANLGNAGDLVKVAAGYGRNFLIPRGLAILASEGNVVQAEHGQRMADDIRRKNLSSAEDIAAEIGKAEVTIVRQANDDDDRLFGSVTNRDIAEALVAQGINIDKRMIQLEQPIKSLGSHTVIVAPHRDVTGELTVHVSRG
jgi:large subunit ribosomal protein L9